MSKSHRSIGSSANPPTRSATKKINNARWCVKKCAGPGTCFHLEQRKVENFVRFFFVRLAVNRTLKLHAQTLCVRNRTPPKKKEKKSNRISKIARAEKGKSHATSARTDLHAPLRAHQFFASRERANQIERMDASQPASCKSFSRSLSLA